MKLDDLLKAQDDARAFIDEHGAQGFEFNHIVTLCYVTILMKAGPSASAPGHMTATIPTIPTSTIIPDWFVSALPSLAGQKLSSSAVLAAMGRPTDIGSTRAAGAWLRQLCGDPKRSNGQTMFLIGLRASPPADAKEKPDSPMEDDPENPYPASLPMAARVTNFAAINDGHRVTAEQVAIAIGVPSNRENLGAIWGQLETYGRQQPDRSFILGKNR